MKFHQMTQAKQQFIEACLDAQYDPPSGRLCLSQLRHFMENSVCYVFTQTLKPKNTEGVPAPNQEKESAKVLQKYFCERDWFYYMVPETTEKDNVHWHGFLWKRCLYSLDHERELKQLKKYMGQKLGSMKIYRIYDLCEPFSDLDYPKNPVTNECRITSFSSQVKYINKGPFKSYWWFTKDF